VEPDEFEEGKVPEEDYYNFPPIFGERRRAFDAPMGMKASLEPRKL
jgi:hypothetical protein